MSSTRQNNQRMENISQWNNGLIYHICCWKPALCSSLIPINLSMIAKNLDRGFVLHLLASIFIWIEKLYLEVCFILLIVCFYVLLWIIQVILVFLWVGVVDGYDWGLSMMKDLQEVQPMPTQQNWSSESGKLVAYRVSIQSYLF